MSATDHTLTDAERAMFERIEDTGDTQGLAWRVQELVTEARALADEESASRVALANQLATAEAEKEALRADRDALRVGRPYDERDGACICDYNPETTDGPQEDCPHHGRPYAYWIEYGDKQQTRAEAAEAALAGLVAGLSELADDLAARAEHCHNLADDETSREEKKRLNGETVPVDENPYRADSIEQARP